MTRYTVDQREWVPTPYGFDVWVIPGRELVSTLEPLPDLPAVINPPGATIRYLIAYLTIHGSATAHQMTPADGRITQGTLAATLAQHRNLFVSTTRVQGVGGANIWRLRGQP